MVMNIGALREKDYELVRRDIAGVVAAAAGRAKVKVIIETCYLTDREIVAASLLCQQAGADYVKTSTGFGTDGARERDVPADPADGRGHDENQGVDQYQHPRGRGADDRRPAQTGWGRAARRRSSRGTPRPIPRRWRTSPQSRTAEFVKVFCKGVV